MTELNITYLEKIRNERKELEKRYTEAFRPILTDPAHVKSVHRAFDAALSDLGIICRKPSQYQQRFIMLAILLFCPGVLFGDKMPSGLRCEISRELKITRQSSISDNAAVILLYYKTYKDFKNHVDYLYAEILLRLAIEGILPESKSI